MTKASAWDALGLEWWRQSPLHARPDRETISWFLGDLRPGARVLVVGGTTVNLIRTSAHRAGETWVADFSRRICAELAGVVPSSVRIAHRDILSPPSAWRDGFDAVLADTLLNRFDLAEATRFTAVARDLLRPGGALRMTVKLGLYPLDSLLLRRDDAPEFWNEREQTFDYRLARRALEEESAPYGALPRDALLRWRLGRGREKRFSRRDVEALFDRRDWSELALEADSVASDRIRLEARRPLTGAE